MNIPKINAFFETSLASAMTAAATSFTIVSGADKESNSISGLYGFVIDEGTADEEVVIGTVSGTTVTVVYRGIDSDAPNTEVSANKKAHRRGASVKITDYPIIGVLRNILNGDDTLPNKISYASHPTFSSNTELVDKKYVDDVALAGAPDASTTVKGVMEEATQAEIDADTAAGGTSARLAINPSTLATSKYGTQLPSSGEKSALVGTSGTPGSGNKYVTNDDTASAATASKVARRNATGDITVPSTPGASTDATSKSYVDTQVATKVSTFKNGVASRAGDAASGTQTIAHGVGATPKVIKITAMWASGNDDLIQSFGVYNGTTTSCVWFQRIDATDESAGTSSTNVIHLPSLAADSSSQKATVAIDATNITLTWTKTGSPSSESIHILWEAIA